MSSILAESTDGDGIDSMKDRYTVVHTIRVSDNDADSQNTSVSMHNLSSNTESSSDSGTCGTSFATEGSDVLEPDGFFDADEYGDLDTLSLGSHPMVDGWVDSACSWIDHPISLIQRIAFGRETSLLRQSKGRTRSTICKMNAISSVSNMKLSTMERRNLRLHRKGIHTNGETTDIESAMGRLALEDAKKKEIKIMRIQPKENFECRRFVSDSSEKKGPPPSSKTNEVGKELATTDIEKKDNDISTIKHDPTAMNLTRPGQSREGKEVTNDKINEELEEADDSIADTKITEERTMENSSTQDKYNHPQLSSTSNSTKIDPPIVSKIASIDEDQPTGSFSSNALRGLESSESETLTESLSQKGDTEDLQSLSNRGEHSIVKRNSITESAMDRGKIVPQGNELGITDLTHIDTNSTSTNDDISRQFPDNNGQKIEDDKVLSSDIEIIDVLSMDDQDSWIPGSRNDQEHSIGKEKKKHQDIENKSKNIDHTSLYSVKGSTSNHKRDIASESNGDQVLAIVDDIWIEEEEKLNTKIAANGETFPGSTSLNNAEIAEDVWNEEKLKLQTTPDDVFGDPKTREAFLGHRRGRLRDIGMDGNNKISRSQSRRRKLRNVLRGERGESDGNKGSKRLSRSRSLGIRNPPSPEDGAVIKQSRSKSREGRLVSKPIPSQKDTEHHNASTTTTPPSRVKDLVVVRSIAEGQRIRSSKREYINYGAGSHLNDPISVSKFVGEASTRGPYDEDSSRSRHRRISDRRTKSSRQRSKSRVPTDANLAKTKESKNKNLTNDERDDQESVPTVCPSESRPVNTEPVANNRSDYDNAISATKELRKLEKKIEQQLRQAKRESKNQDSWDSQTVPSKEIRRMEKKLAKKLKAVTSDNPDSQTVSSKEIRRLEKQLAQKLSGENENRASKLKRIKRKVSKSAVVEPDEAKSYSSAVSKEHHELHQVSSRQTEHDIRGDDASPELLTSTSPSVKTLSPQNQDNHHEMQKSDNLRSLRSSRYLRRGTNNLGHRISRRIPEND